jgi:hypothetical protein
MSRVQECSFECDRGGECVGFGGVKPGRSPACGNWTEARKHAEAGGWFIRPAENKPEHICPVCVEEALTNGTAKAKDGADQGVSKGS